MSASQRRHLSPDDMEKLLRGRAASGPANPAAGHAALARLLAVATAPAHGRELAGEADAVAAFRQARISPVSQRRRSTVSVTKLLTAKAIIAAAGLTGGGVALAAATGHLPPGLTGAPAATSPASAAATAPPSGSAASHPTPSPSPSLRGLCRAYATQASGSPGKAVGNPAFSVLITSAGGKNKVAAFCSALLAAKPGTGHASHPAGTPGSLPTTANTTHPTGKPSTLPASHATGQPSTAGQPPGTPATDPASHATAQPSAAGRPSGKPSPHP